MERRRPHRPDGAHPGIILEGQGDLDEVVGLEGGAADEAAVDVGLGEELLGVGGLAGAAVEDRGVVGDGLAEQAGEDVADVGVDLFGLGRSGGLAGADGPDGLVGDDDLLHILGAEVGEDGLGLVFDDLEVLAGFALVKVLSDAEDDAEFGGEGEFDFLDELLVGLAVVLAALGVAEDGPLAADGLEHVDGDFAGVGALGVVGAVLGGKLDFGAFEGLAAAAEVGEGRGDDEADAGRDFRGAGHDGLRQFDTIRSGRIHLPVACNDFLSHNIVNK